MTSESVQDRLWGAFPESELVRFFELIKVAGVTRSAAYNLLTRWVSVGAVERHSWGTYRRITSEPPRQRCAGVLPRRVLPPEAMQLVEAMDRFWSKVDTRSGACWLWCGGTNRGGYGTFFFDGQQVNAHRWLYEHEVGPVPDGLELDHLCRVRACVRLAHLEPVTHVENLRRGLESRGQRRVTDSADGTHAYVLFSSANKLPPQRAGVRGLLFAEDLADNRADNPANNHGSDGE